MAADIKVVLFEDTTEAQSAVLGALKRHLGKDGDVVLFDAAQFKESESDQDKMYEDRIESILRRAPFDDATLIVADRDLSKSVSSGFRGLSVNAVATAASRLAMPICSYARQPEPDDYEWRGRWEEGHIVLRFGEGEDELSRRAVIAGRGFANIADGLPAVLGDAKNNSPAKVLAALLGRPDYADKIALYSVGDQNRLSDLPANPKETGQQVRQLTRFLGYWLWDSLLRYPGLLANEIAAASHLNLSPADFMRQEVRSVFETALYHGPFEDARRPQWWRGSLDNIVANEGFADGLELVHKNVRPEAERSRCYVDERKSAGYYCIIARKPVSLENSRGGLSWFPRGADLTRIGTPMFEEYGPWLGA
jgi:hypothetical protein